MEIIEEIMVRKMILKIENIFLIKIIGGMRKKGIEINECLRFLLSDYISLNNIIIGI